MSILLSVQSLSQIGAIIDFSTGVAFFRHLTDQSVVQLERETTCYLHLSPVEDRLSKTISDKYQLQGSKQLRRFWEISTNQENTGCLAASSHTHVIRDSGIRQHNTPVTTNQLQTAITTPVSHARQLPGSTHHSTTNVPSLTVNMNESDSDVSVGSRRTQEGRMPTTVRCLGEVQPRRGILVLELKAMIKDLLLSKQEERESPLLGVARMTRSQLADKARQLQIPVSENHTRGHLSKITREDLMQQSTPRAPDYLGFGNRWITNTVVGSIRWRISSPLGN